MSTSSSEGRALGGTMADLMHERDPAAFPPNRRPSRRTKANFARPAIVIGAAMTGGFVGHLTPATEERP